VGEEKGRQGKRESERGTGEREIEKRGIKRKKPRG
jgi:hypothetical protein